MISTVCLITSRATGPHRREGISSLERQLRAEYPGARFVTVGDEAYLAPGREPGPHEAPGADAAFVRDGVRLGAEEVPEKFRKHVAAMQLRHVANARKHMDCLKAVASDPSGGVGLVLEDDAVIGRDWKALLVAAAAGVATADRQHPGGCIGFLGIPLPLADESGAPRSLLEDFEVSPVCDSYLVGPAAAACLSGGFLPIRFRTNVHLSYLAETLGGRAVAFRTNAFCDGSKLGTYASSLNVNNRLILNGEYTRARRILEGAQAMTDARERKEAAARAKELITSSPLKGNSDMMFLRGVCEAELGGPRQGRVAFAAAYAAAVSAGALINNESELLNSLIAQHGDLASQPGLEARRGPEFAPAFSDGARKRQSLLRRLPPSALGA